MKHWIRMMILVLAVMFCLPMQVEAAETARATGGIHILKTDVGGTPLSGASFRILRELRDGELTDSAIQKELVRTGTENRIMTAESFWTDREMDGKKQSAVISGPDGMAAIYGLPYGTYYLVEEKAPRGYNRILEPIRITVHKYSHLTAQDSVYDDQNVLIDNTVHIINLRYTLPDTGNLGAIQLAAGGTGILFSSAALLLLNRKRWR